MWRRLRVAQRTQTAVHDGASLAGRLASAGYGARASSFGGQVGLWSAAGSARAIVDGIEDLFQMRNWLARLLRKERHRSAEEDSAAVSSPGPVWSDPEIPDEERAVLLVCLIEDPTAREDEQEEAAWCLEFLSGPFVEAALIRAIRDGDFNSDLAQACAESLAGIWAREGQVDAAFLAELRGLAKELIFGILGNRAPHLLPPSAL